MHTDTLEVTVEMVDGTDVVHVLGLYPKQRNGVQQWSVDPVNAVDDGEFIITAKKGVGLDHVDLENSFERWASEREEIESFTVDEYTKNI